MAINKNNKASETRKPARKLRKENLEAKAPAEPSNQDRGLTVVGIGASAGGLEALGKFFDALPSNTGMAFVIVTHLHPEHESHLAELLQSHTRMPTMQVAEKTKVEADHVYVIPPNRSILMTDTHLETKEFKEPHGKRTPIDFFFRSLASVHRESIAVILFGGGTDGSVGINDINEPEATTELSVPRSEVERDQMVTQLEAEVQRLREQLQITLEENDSSNEEMKAATEELQSVNEELQTVNTDMKNKLEEISQAHQELESLLGATEIGTLFLDRELRIQRFTAGVNDIINIMPTDRGRPISHLTHKLRYDKFREDAEQVLRRLTPMEQEVRTEKNEWYLLRFRPYLTTRDQVEGVVITFINITALKESQEQLLRTKETLEQRVLERTRELNEANHKIRQARDLFYGLFNANPIPTALLQLEDQVFLNVNNEFLSYFGLQREAVIGHSAEEFSLGLGLGTSAHDSIDNQLKRQGRVRNFEVQISHPSGEKRNILASVQYLNLENTKALIATFIDITDRVRAEKRNRLLASSLTQAEQTERHRISQVLHDDLQQRLFAIKSQLSLLSQDIEKDNLERFQKDIAEMEAGLTDSISITRNLSIDISPIILHGEGLTDAIAWLSSRMQEQYGLNVDLKIANVKSNYEESLRVMLFQAIRELLFNVIKHAETLEAEVEFENLDHRTRITVSDQGKGFDVDEVMNNKHIANGLLSIRHRLSIMGCYLDLTSEPGKGTRVTIDCPIPQPDS